MVGVGGFGWQRRQWMRQTGLFELVACYDHNSEAMSKCVAEEGCRACESYEALLDTCGAEVVVISTGAKWHARQVRMALERGLHVFVEKPLCATPQEIADLVQAARCRPDLRIAVGHNDLTDPISRATKRLITSGRLGTIVSFERTTAHGGGFHIKPGDWRGDPTANPGGFLFQCGVHALHELMHYFGPIRAVSATMRYDVNCATATADAAVCVYRFVNGVVGTLNAYHVTPYRHTLSLFGTRANLYRDDRYFDEGSSLTLQDRDSAGGKELRVPVDVGGEPSDPANSMRTFYQAITTGGQPYPGLEDGVRAVAGVHAAEKSAQLGREVEVSTFPALQSAGRSDCCRPQQGVRSLELAASSGEPT
jgi:predicted dehydrogenase